MQEKFLVKDIYGQIRTTVEDRDGYLMNENEDNPLTFDTYPEASNHISGLENGIYQIEKVFVVVRDGSNDMTQKVL